MADLIQQDLQLPRANMPDNTGASRGIDATNMFDKLFSGIGDTLSVTTKMADSDVQDNIRKDARSNYESLLSDSGVGNDTETPQGVADGIDQLKLMQNAYEQGRITDTHFYGRMTAQLKSLRAKYPGYEDIVDNAVQDITGVRPANAYRNALMDMINQEQQTSQNEENKWENWLNQNDEYIPNVAPDFYDNPEKYDRNELRAQVAKYKAKDQAIQSENLNISNLVARDQLSEEQATETVTSQVSQLVSMNFETLNRTMGLDKINAGIANGVTPSGEEFAQLGMSFQQQKNAMRQKLLLAASKPLGEDTNDNWYSVVGTEKVNKIIDEVMAPYNQIEAYIGAKDLNMATYHSQLNQYTSDRDLSTILNKSPEFRTGSAISKISPALGEAFFNNNEGARSAVQNLTPEILSNVALGNDTVGGAASRVVNSRQNANDKGAAVKDLIDGAINGIVSGGGSPKERKDFIQGAYDPASTGALFKLVKPEEYQRLYAKMYNPEVTKAILATGDKKTVDLYAASAMDRIGSIPEIRRMAGDMQEGIVYAKYIDVEYDEKTNRLNVKFNPPASSKNDPVLATWQNNKMIKKMAEGKDALNTVFATLGPIIEASGGNETEAIKAVIKNLAIDVDAGEKDTLLWSLYNKISSATESDKEREPKPGMLPSNTLQPDFKNGVELGSPVTEPAGQLPDGFLQKMRDSVTDGKSFGDTVNEFQGEFNQGPERGIPVNKDGTMKARPASLMMGNVRGLGNSSKVARGGGGAKGDLGEINTSNKRGYTPDTKNLRPSLKQGILDLQEVWGEPLTVISGYRGKARNKKAGGAKKSQHIHGNAVDIDVSSWSIKKRQKFIMAARKAGFGGIGTYDDSIHIDKGRRRAWGPDYHAATIKDWAKPYL
mgnify:CR=1 FL=1